MSNKIDTQDQNQVQLLENDIKMIMEQLFKNTVEKKVETDFTAAVGSYQPIAIDTSVGIIRDEERVQKKGAELLTNPHVLSCIKLAVTDYVRTETEAAIRDNKGEHHWNICVNTNKLSVDVTALQNQIKDWINALEKDVQGLL